MAAAYVEKVIKYENNVLTRTIARADDGTVA